MYWDVNQKVLNVPNSLENTSLYSYDFVQFKIIRIGTNFISVAKVGSAIVINTVIGGMVFELSK